MHQSYFSYKLERKYPLKWFTWAAVLGGLCLAALFTTINIATNAYEPHFFYTTNPNDTMKERHWYDDKPFSLTKTPSTKCDTTSIPIGMKVYSDKMGLPYELSGVETNWTETDNGVKAPSLIYLNNILQDCKVTIVQVFLDNVIDSDALTLSRANWNPRLSSKVFCNIEQDDSTTRLELSVSWNPTKDGPVMPVNKDTSLALWWAWNLLRWYSAKASMTWRKVVDDIPEQDKPLKGYISFNPTDTTDVQDRDFFKLGSMFTWTKHGQKFVTHDSHLVSDWIDGKMNYSAAATAFEGYAKSFYSLILAELGQNTSSLVTKPAALKQYTKEFDGEAPKVGSLLVDTTIKSYSEGNLTVANSTLYAQYFCQEPKRKSMGSLFVAVIMADLVFLSAAWTLLNWVAAAWVGHYDKNSMHCAGCVAILDQGQHELQMLKPATDSDVPLLGPGQI